MTYHEAVKLIEGSSKRRKLYPIYLRLERMRLIFEYLEIDRELPSVHIAGTSGKGSTSTLCAAVLQANGHRVGLHTTPHLQTTRERMQVNGQLPTEDQFIELTESVYQAALTIEEQHSYGAFNSQELIFTIAALYFKQQQVDIAVVETFMGGQYDPTNIINPLVSVITNVDLDHTRLLGKTVEAIAFVKSGVIKPNTPFITGATQPSVLQIFKNRCADLKTECIVIGQQNKHQARLLGQKGSMLSATVLNNLFANLHLSLLGKHQINNALMVLYIIQVLRTRGWLINDQAIRDGFAQAFIPGRLEIVEQQPITILDGAHNPAKTKALAQSLRRIFKNKKVVFVFAMKKSKNLEESIKPLLPLADKFIVTRFSETKSHRPTRIHQFIKSHGIPVITRLEPLAALQLAQRQVKKDQILCVTGSLYLVGKLRGQWHPEAAESVTVALDDTGWRTGVGEPILAKEIIRSRQ